MQKLTRMASNLDKKEVEPLLLDAAVTVADEMRRNAPVGPTGNLKRSVVAKLLPSRGFQMRGAFAGVAREKKGYHVHLVEYGTQDARQPKKKKVLASKALMGIGWGQVFGTKVGRMPAKPFLRPAVDTKGRQVLPDIEKKLWNLLIKGV
jgi:HK97 gp10 family phage protein